MPALRLARELCRLGHTVTLAHNNPTTLQALMGNERLPGLSLLTIDFEQANAPIDPALDLILEPFGSSNADGNPHTLLARLQQQFAATPWLTIDYLSAEAWTQAFHLTPSIKPTTGHRSWYFYPGFGPHTGGLIHNDWPSLTGHEALPSNTHPFKKLFVFCYATERVQHLHAALEPTQSLHLANRNPNTNMSHTFQVDFCAQREFDRRLLEFDFLLVRGEDSFVRAQLAGKPFVWEIYPTPDGAHRIKLEAFFTLYTQNLDAQAARALKTLWLAWNGFLPATAIGQAWLELMPHQDVLSKHAQQWQAFLFKGPDLVQEILNWRQSLN